jgi:hypothetical protein
MTTSRREQRPVRFDLQRPVRFDLQRRTDLDLDPADHPDPQRLEVAAIRLRYLPETPGDADGQKVPLTTLELDARDDHARRLRLRRDVRRRLRESEPQHLQRQHRKDQLQIDIALHIASTDSELVTGGQICTGVYRERTLDARRTLAA